MRRISKAAVVVAASSISLLGATGIASASVSTNPSAGTETTTAAANPSAPADNGGSNTGTKSSDTPKPTESKTTSAPAGGDQSGEPSTPGYCAPITNPADVKVKVEIQGLQGKTLVAGGAPVTFKVVTTNHSGATLPSPRLLIAIGGSSDWSKSEPILKFGDGHGHYEQVPLVWDGEPTVEGWVTEASTGPLPDNQYATLDASLAFPAGTPAGKGVNVDIATDASCPGDEGADSPLGAGVAFFNVVASTHTSPAGDTGSAPTSKPIDITKVHPSTTATAPVTVTSLAHTGADGTPTLAIVGGCVVVAGAGLVFFGRRKLRGSHSA